MSDARMSHQQLIAYAAGELSGAEAAEVERHLSRSPAAARTVAAYRQASAALSAEDGQDPPPETVRRAKAVFDPQALPAGPPGLVDRIAQAVARLVYDSRLQPAVAGLRGSATSFQLTYELLGARLELEAEIADDSAEEPQWRMVGQITAPAAPPRCTAALRAAGEARLVQTADVDEHGVFVLRAGPGTYDLHLEMPDRVAVVPDIRFP